MKKIIFIVLVVLSFNGFSQNQTCEYFMNKIIIDNDIVIKKVITTDSSYSVIAELPSYYDFELFKMKFNSTVRNYSDIKVHIPWGEYSPSEMFTVLLITSKKLKFFTGYSHNTVYFILPL